MRGFLVKANEVYKIANSTFVKCLFISFPLVSVSVWQMGGVELCQTAWLRRFFFFFFFLRHLACAVLGDISV